MSEIQKLKEGVTSTGWGILIIGYIYIVLGFFLTLVVLGDKTSTFSLPMIALYFIFGIVSVILGNRIRKLKDKNIKLYLGILSIIYLVIGILSGFFNTSLGILGLVNIFVIVFSLLSMNRFGRLMKSQEFVSSLGTQKYTINTIGWIIFSFLSLMVFLFALMFSYMI